ncbi:MAG: ABC transporter ATP-binding protein [Caldilineales bacterium]
MRIWTGGRAALDGVVAARLRQVGLDQVAGQRIGSCSKGMLQRLGLAVALIGDPSLLVLDEPMEGLDPAWQIAVRDLIGRLRRDGTTVLVSTHRLSDVAEVCDHVAILSHGQLKRAGALDDVLPLRERVVIDVDRVPRSLVDSVPAAGTGVTWHDSQVILEGPGVAAKSDVLRLLLDGGADVCGLRQERLSLEEIYLEAMRS